MAITSKKRNYRKKGLIKNKNRYSKSKLKGGSRSKKSSNNRKKKTKKTVRRTKNVTRKNIHKRKQSKHKGGGPDNGVLTPDEIQLNKLKSGKKDMRCKMSWGRWGSVKFGEGEDSRPCKEVKAKIKTLEERIATNKASQDNPPTVNSSQDNNPPNANPPTVNPPNANPPQNNNPSVVVDGVNNGTSDGEIVTNE